jgi:NPCBM/NEW2 domain/FecR protein
MVEKQEPDPVDSKAAFAARVIRYLEDALSPDELTVFNKELSDDAAKRDQFVRLCMIQTVAAEELATEYSMLRGDFHAGGLPVEPMENKPLKVVQPRRSTWGWRTVAAALIVMAIPTWLYIDASLHRPEPPKPVVATIGAQMNATWQNVGPEGGRFVRENQHLRLNTGWAELNFNAGATVMLRGPVEFSAVSPDSLDLGAGVITAKKVGGGFVVSTAQGQIDDLGTEFGVSAGMNGETQVAVFSGRVAAAFRTTDKKLAPGHVLEKGQAARVTDNSVDMHSAMAWPQMFPRKLADGVRSLNMADLLAGGDGTMERRLIAIDLSTGNTGTLTPRNYDGDHAYHAVPSVPVIDGCFVPDGTMQLDSAGDRFAFPRTSNYSYNHLWTAGNGQRFPWMVNHANGISPVLAGIDYSGADHWLLELHSNKAVTFDLEALRDMHPGSRFTAFQSIVGNSYPLSYNGKPTICKTDIFVLVDGKTRLEKRGFSNEADPLRVDVPLNEKDRFLTIVVSDGGDKWQGDWMVWGDPRIIVDN